MAAYGVARRRIHSFAFLQYHLQKILEKCLGTECILRIGTWIRLLAVLIGALRIRHYLIRIILMKFKTN